MYIFEIIVIVLLLVIIAILLNPKNEPMKRKTFYYRYDIKIKIRNDQNLDPALLTEEFTEKSIDEWELVTVIPCNRESIEKPLIIQDITIKDPVDLDFYVYRKLIQD